MMTAPELGFGLRSIGRGIKKAGKGAYKVSKATVKYTVIEPTKIAAKLAMLPLIYLRRAVVTIGRTLCKAPPELLRQVAVANGINPAFVPAFCEAVRINRWGLSAIKRYLPTALKLAIKLGATGAFPPIMPALRIARAIPGVSQFLGAGELGAIYDTKKFRNSPALRSSFAAMEMVAFADYLDLLDEVDVHVFKLSPEDRAKMQSVLAGSFAEAQSGFGGWQDPAFLRAMGTLGIAAFPVIGLYVLTRK